MIGGLTTSEPPLAIATLLVVISSSLLSLLSLSLLSDPSLELDDDEELLLLLDEDDDSSSDELYKSSFWSDLVVVEGDIIPFNVSRVFTVRASKGSVRGQHAHRHCSQLLICTNGGIEVKCDDGRTTEKYVLDKANFAIPFADRFFAVNSHFLIAIH